MIHANEIMQTIEMIDQQNLDIRTITMGISLRDCADPDIRACCRKIYDKITRYAENLVKTGNDIESEFGIPIVNKRISVTPVALIAESCGADDYVSVAKALDDAAKTVGVNFIGGFSALVHKGFTAGDRKLTRGQSEVIAGFAAEYQRSSKGIIQIVTPNGALNSGAAASAAGEIRQLLVRMGVPKNMIVQNSYPAGDYGTSAPVRLSYVAIAAQTGPCGEWPEDMTLNTVENKNYYNFGCASQRNLAAQIADPNDLLGPRRMTPADAEQRGQAMERYRGAYTELRDM